MPTVRTTMRPDQEITVGDAEYLDLQRQGLLANDEPPQPDAPAPAAKKTPAPPASGATKEG